MIASQRSGRLGRFRPRAEVAKTGKAAALLPAGATDETPELAPRSSSTRCGLQPLDRSTGRVHPESQPPSVPSSSGRGSCSSTFMPSDRVAPVLGSAARAPPTHRAAPGVPAAQPVTPQQWPQAPVLQNPSELPPTTQSVDPRNPARPTHLL